MVNSNELFLINYWKMITTISIMSNPTVLPDGTVISSCDPQTGQCVHPQTGEQISFKSAQIIKILVDIIYVRLNDGTRIRSYLIRYCRKSESYIRIDTNERITLSKEYQSFLTLNHLEEIVRNLFEKYSETNVNVSKVSEKGYDPICYIVRLDKYTESVPFTHLQMTQIKYIGDGLTHLFFSRRGSDNLFQIVEG
jgi:hypothetical protein